MSYRYRDPKTILSPKDAVSKVEVIFDDGEYSVAKLAWYGEEKLGIRWNIGLREWDDSDKQSGTKECLGVPTSRSHPTWFILPDAFADSNSEVLKKLQNTFIEK